MILIILTLYYRLLMVSQDMKGFGDYWVIKIDSIGNKEWDRAMEVEVAGIPWQPFS